MSDDVGVVVAAVIVVAAALVAVPFPVPAAVAVLAAALVTRRPALVVLALAVLVGARAESSASALAAPLPAGVDGVASLMSDPAPRRFGVQVVIGIDGRRYLAEVPTDRAAELRPMLTGERVRVVGRPRPLEGAPVGWVMSRHLAGRLSVRSVEAVDAGPLWYRAANVVHRTITAGASTMDVDRASLYSGLVLGDDRDQSELTQFRFQASGLTHLLAVSGQNVAFVLAVAAPLLRRSSLRGRLGWAAVLLTLFVLVTRAEPSVLRAAIMAGVAMLAVTAGRSTSGLRVLSLTVMIVLVVDPLLVRSVGFQLSVCATAGLLLVARPLAERLPGPDWLRVPLAVTIAAQLATAPLLLGLAGGLPSIAVVANLLAGPAAGAVMMLGVTVGVLAGMVRDPWASWLQTPAELLVGWVDSVATVSSRAPAPTLGAWQVAAVVAAGVAAVVATSRRRVARLRWASGIAAGALVVGSLWPASVPPGRHPLGDGSSWSTGKCGSVVDVHGADSPAPLLEELWRLGVRRADVVVAGEGQRNRAVAAAVAEQLGARSATPGGAAMCR